MTLFIYQMKNFILDLYIMLILSELITFIRKD